MRDKKTSDLPLPFAPVLDETGVHVPDCQCTRCELGYRPTMAERHAARMAWQRRQAAKVDADAGERKAARAARHSERAAAAAAALAAKLRADREAGKRAALPSDEELAALAAQHGLRRKRR